MKKLYFSEENFEKELEEIYNRPGYPPEIEAGVAEILARVKSDGDQALVEFAAKFDHVNLTPELFRVTEEEIAEATRLTDKSAKLAIKRAIKAVQEFAFARRPKNWKYSPRNGVHLGEKFCPIDRVGVYIPGGTAPLVSTVIHTAGIANAANVPEIVAVTPPGPDGKIHPAVLYAMRMAGVTEIYRLGGVYGIAAMAYGTDTIKPVEKIVGPGNAYVTAAKKLVYGTVAIDMVAGPSEIMVVADKNAPANFIAADMLSQAEHGSGLEQAVLVTTDATLIDRVEAEIERQKATLPRVETVNRVLERGVYMIAVPTLDKACEIASKYAPEHIELMVENPQPLIRKIRAAGAIFVGPWTPESAGDFCAGPSHVLPTAGSGKFFAGLSIESFYRRSSIVEFSKLAIGREIRTIEKFAELEGLDAHGRAGTIRGKSI